MLAREIQTFGNHPKETIQHAQHGERLKSRKIPGRSLITTVGKRNNSPQTYRQVPV